MDEIISKTQFKARVLEYFRRVQATRKPLIITDRGRPVVKIIPYVEEGAVDPLEALRGSVMAYEDPFEPVGLEDWESLE